MHFSGELLHQRSSIQSFGDLAMFSWSAVVVSKVATRESFGWVFFHLMQALRKLVARRKQARAEQLELDLCDRVSSNNVDLALSRAYSRAGCTKAATVNSTDKMVMHS